MNDSRTFRFQIGPQAIGRAKVVAHSAMHIAQVHARRAKYIYLDMDMEMEMEMEMGEITITVYTHA